MSEEEIIKIIKYMLENRNTDINVIINYEAIQGLLNLYTKQQEKIEDYKKFKKDIVSKIMFWDKEELPDNERIMSMLDTLMEEVSRLEDIEDKKVEVAIGFIEEKRDKFWKDEIREVLKDLDEFDDYFFNVATLKEAVKNSLNRILEEK